LTFVAGSQIRSLWLVLAAAIPIVIALSPPWRRAFARHWLRALGPLAVVPAAVAGGLLLARHASVPALHDAAARIERHASRLWDRARSLVPTVGLDGRPTDVSYSYRLEETHVLVDGFVTSSLSEKVFGNGLGSTYVSTLVGLDGVGNPIPGSPTNYIHNYLLFLLVKLGVVGSAATLAAIFLWIRWTIRAARTARDEPHRTLLVAASAAWIAGLAWSLSSPAIIDFRIAPLFGILLATSAATATGAAGSARPGG
jgi:O-antigen ligase